METSLVLAWGPRDLKEHLKRYFLLKTTTGALPNPNLQPFLLKETEEME